MIDFKQSRQQSRRASMIGISGSAPELRFKSGYGCGANWYYLLITFSVSEIISFSYCFGLRMLSWKNLSVQGRTFPGMFRAGFPRSFPPKEAHG